LKKTTAAAKAALKDPSRKKNKTSKCSSDKFWDKTSKKCLSKSLKCKIGLEVWDGKKCKKVKCPKGQKMNKKTGICIAK
jgi:hypothetical protein